MLCRKTWSCLIALAGGLVGLVPANAANVAGGPAEAFHMPAGRVETRWYTYENPQGEKGKGGMAKFGRKGAPCVGIGEGKTLTVLDIEGSGTVRRIWATQRKPTGTGRARRRCKGLSAISATAWAT